MGSPFSPIPYDVVITGIFPYLNVQDLGRLMQVNRTFCAYSLRDEAWQHIRRQCTQVAPFVEEWLFKPFAWHDEEYNDEQGARKKARLRKSDKKPYKFPVGGTWYVLKTFLVKARDAGSLRRFLSFRKPCEDRPPAIFLKQKRYSIAYDHILILAKPSNYNRSKLHDFARVVVIAFACRLQSPSICFTRIKWEGGILSYVQTGENGTTKEICHIDRRLGLWRGPFSSWTKETKGFKEVFYF